MIQEHPELLSVSQYAKHRSVERASVYAAIQSGRISTIKDAQGKIKINPHTADEQWLKNTDLMKQNRTKSHPSTDPVQLDSEIPPLEQSRQIKTWYDAQLLKLEYQKKAGELVDAKKVQEQSFTLGRQLRDAILQVPDRISSQLAAESNPTKVHQLLMDELTIALRALSSHG